MNTMLDLTALGLAAGELWNGFSELVELDSVPLKPIKQMTFLFFF